MNKLELMQKSKEELIELIESETKRNESLGNSIDDAYLKILGCGDIFQCLFDRYNLDSLQLTENEQFDYIMNRNSIYMILNHLQNTVDQVESILEQAH